MIRNNYHSIHLNTAMSLNMVFVLEQVAAVGFALCVFAVIVAVDILRIAATHIIYRIIICIWIYLRYVIIIHSFSPPFS